VRTLHSLALPALATLLLGASPASPFAPTVPAVTVAAGEAVLQVDLRLPDGRKLSSDAHHVWQAVGTDGVGVRLDGEQDLSGTRLRVPLEVVADGQVSLTWTVFHCTPSDCKRSDQQVDVPIVAGPVVPLPTTRTPHARISLDVE